MGFMVFVISNFLLVVGSCRGNEDWESIREGFFKIGNYYLYVFKGKFEERENISKI